MINHFNFERFENRILITNDMGEYVFLGKDDFAKLVTGKIESADICYSELVEKYFVTEKSISEFSEEITSLLRSMKSYVFSPTALHIFALTNMCNMNCVYCQAKSPNSSAKGMMSVETGLKAIELAMQSPAKYMTLEFQGGEPLLNFDVFKAMVCVVRIPERPGRIRTFE